MAPANKALREVADEHGVTWLTCGDELDPEDPSVLYDGTHPTQEAQARLLRCLAPAVYRLVGSRPGEDPQPSPLFRDENAAVPAQEAPSPIL